MESSHFVYLAPCGGDRQARRRSRKWVRAGIHHVTAIAGRRAATSTSTPALGAAPHQKDRQFDDPETYHLFTATRRPAGRDSDVLPWAQAAPAGLGIGENPGDDVPRARGRDRLWTHRFVDKGVSPRGAGGSALARPGAAVHDSDGMRLALVGVRGAENEPAWSNGEIPPRRRSAVFTASACCWRCAPNGGILSDVLASRALPPTAG